MDVFHVGASAPKAPESRNVDRDPPAQKTGSRVQPAQVDSDKLATSSDAAAVKRRVETLGRGGEVRDDVITGMRQLLGKGMFDTPQAAAKAAQGILEA